MLLTTQPSSREYTSATDVGSPPEVAIDDAPPREIAEPAPTPKPEPTPPPTGDIVGPTLAQPRGGLTRNDPRRAYDVAPRRFGGGLLVLGALATAGTTVAAGYVRVAPMAMLGWYVGPPLLAAGAATIGRRRAYEHIWLKGEPPRKLRAREVAAWSAFSVGLGFSIAAAFVSVTERGGSPMDAIAGTPLCRDACDGLYFPLWIVGTLSTAVALPIASHATAYRRRAHDIVLLRRRANEEGLGDEAYGEIGPPRFAGTARIVTGAALLASAVVVIPNVLAWGGDAGGVFGAGVLAAGLIGVGATLVTSGALARRRANGWRGAASSLAFSPTLGGASLHGRF